MAYYGYGFQPVSPQNDVPHTMHFDRYEPGYVSMRKSNNGWTARHGDVKLSTPHSEELTLD